MPEASYWINDSHLLKQRSIAHAIFYWFLLSVVVGDGGMEVEAPDDGGIWWKDGDIVVPWSILIYDWSKSHWRLGSTRSRCPNPRPATKGGKIPNTQIWNSNYLNSDLNYLNLKWSITYSSSNYKKPELSLGSSCNITRYQNYPIYPKYKDMK